MHSINAYYAFVRAIDVGSFSAVAREMGISQSAVSKTMATLESSLGVQLFARTTRRLHPTEEAMQLYEHVRRLLDALDSIRLKDAPQSGASGVLKITMPTVYGRQRIMPLLPRFLAEYPDVVCDVRLTDDVIDLVAEGIELGIRIGEMAPSTLIARSLGILEHRLFASPQYLANAPALESPTDLALHRCIVYRNTSRWTRWEFESEHGRHSIEVTGTVRVDDAEAIRDAALAGLGVAQLPDWLLGSAVSEGRLTPLLNDYYLMPQPVRFIYPQTRFLTQRARCFIDFVLANRDAL